MDCGSNHFHLLAILVLPLASMIKPRFIPEFEYLTLNPKGGQDSGQAHITVIDLERTYTLSPPHDSRWNTQKGELSISE